MANTSISILPTGQKVGNTLDETLLIGGGATTAATPTATIPRDDAGTTTAPTLLRLQRTSSGTPANGIGAGIDFVVETAAGNNEIGAVIQTVTTDCTSTSEDFDLVVKLMKAGATAAEALRVSSAGQVTAVGFTGALTGNADTVTTNANLTGHVTSVGNAAVLGSFTKAQLDTAISDGNAAYVGAANAFTDVNTFADTQVMPKGTGKGFKVDIAAPTWPWRDITGDIQVRGSGAADPSFAIYTGTVLRDYEFSASVEQEFFINFHIPHDYVPGTDIYFHVHWSNPAASPNTGNVVWGFDYSYAKGYNQEAYPAITTITVTQACPATRYQSNIAETAAVTIAGLEPDGIIKCRIYRKAADAADTCTQTVFASTSDVHYQSTGIGTKNRNYPFYT